MATATAAQLARAFCRHLLEDIGPARMQTVVERNRVQTDRGVCHSHDFCDANMDMEAAFIELNVPVFTDDHITEETCVLWNTAWDLAKAAEFNPDNIKD